MFLSDHSNKKRIEINENALINVERCGYCLGKEFEKLLPYSTNPEINFIRCKSCGAVTYDRIFNQAEIDNLYAQETSSNDVHQTYYVDEDGKESNITFFGAQRFAKHILKKYKNKKDKYRILDFGGGDGQLAYYAALELQRRFNCSEVEITVVDYIEQLYKTDDKQIKMEHRFPLDSVIDLPKYDIVIASAIIEHLPDARDYVKTLFEVLDVGGLLYFRTPYMYPLYRDLKKFGIDYDTLYPFHVWDLGGKWYDDLPKHVGYTGKIALVVSKPSIVEKTFRANFFVALASYMLKLPWYICHKWHYVGGWEAIYTKTE